MARIKQLRPHLASLLISLAAFSGPAVTQVAPIPPDPFSIDGVQVPGAPASGAVDLTRLPTSGGPNTSAYQALNVRAAAAGSAFADPVTGVRTVKLTANGTPGTAHYFNSYSTLGLQISQAWGANRNQYTIMFQGDNGMFVVDYQLGGRPTNYRSIPADEGRVAFSRLAGQERIAYIYTGGRLRRYDTATNAYADTGRFPITWPNGTTWLQLNANETWATMIAGNGTVTALRLTDGTVRSRNIAGLDEIYSGYNNTALINASPLYVWNLDTDTLTPASVPAGFNRASHVPSMRGYWIAVNTDLGGGILPYTRIGENGVPSPAFNASGYWGQHHFSGHWWDQPAGNGQYFLKSNWSFQSSWTQSERYGIYFIRADDGSKRILGHSYSEAEQSGRRSNGSDNYRAQPHATQSTDGKIVMFTSNMLDGPRTDVFLMEVPTR